MNKHKCPLTALQFLTMRFIGKGMDAPTLQYKLREQGHYSTKAAFYQLLTRLTDKGFIETGDKFIVTSRGKEAMMLTKKFYTRCSA